MIPVGFALAWIGYAIGFYGRALVKGWNISFTQVASPTSYYKGAWPPPMATNTTVFPSGKASDNAGTSGTGTSKSSTSLPTSKTGTGGSKRPGGGPGSVGGRF
jgi:hypothetical protein